MTREEAIDYLQVMKDDYPSYESVNEALEMAIQALSQEPQCTEHPCLGTLCRYYKEPCEDVISRREALNCLNGAWGDYSVLNEVYERISKLPSVNPQPCDDVVSRKDAIKALQNVACISAAIKSRMVGAIEDLPPVTHKSIECDDAISRILKRMWNCRGKHTTSIDKVAMEQIIRDELTSVTQKGDVKNV